MKRMVSEGDWGAALPGSQRARLLRTALRSFPWRVHMLKALCSWRFPRRNRPCSGSGSALTQARCLAFPRTSRCSLLSFLPDAIDAAVLGQLDRLFAAVSRFRFRLDHTGWFSVEVLWLGPQEPPRSGP